MAGVALAESKGGERGREARTPADVPRRGWRDVLLRVKERISRENLSIISAGVAFYALMAIFPALVALVAIYGLAFDPRQVGDQVAALGGMLPKEAADILLSELRDLTSTNTTALSTGAIVGVVVAFWSASAGIRTLMKALNVAYGEDEKRGFVRFYSTALLLTCAALVGFCCIIAVIVALPLIARFVGLGPVADTLVSLARWPIVALAVIFGLAIMYRYGPSREKPRWTWVSHGAIFATVAWIIGSILFSLYVSHFGSYNKTYGSAGAAVILLTWLLLSAYAVLIGAEINAESERQTRRDTTTGREEPLGRRGAYAADTVGRVP